MGFHASGKSSFQSFHAFHVTGVWWCSEMNETIRDAHGSDGAEITLKKLLFFFVSCLQ